MLKVELTEAEWQQVIACMSYAPGRECIGLMNKIGAQLQPQQARPTPVAEPEALRKRSS